jgi:alkane 1-monooxygenase
MELLRFTTLYLTPLGIRFGLLPGVAGLLLLMAVFDAIIKPEKENKQRKAKRKFDGLVLQIVAWSWIPLHASLVLWALGRSSSPLISVSEYFTLMFQIGMIGGIFGISLAHELMHKHSRVEQRLAEALMIMMSYPHFCIEHRYGHHSNVATPLDPATARLGESFYLFYPRAVVGSIRSAWCIEKARLRRLNLCIWDYRNRMLNYCAIISGLYILDGFAFGWKGILLFFGQSIIAISILELMNYIQHYGLTRKQLSTRCYETIHPHHAWNSNHVITNCILWNLGRHPDHHCQSDITYANLHNIGSAPQLPAGYFSMFVAALMPPLWFKIMDDRIDRWRRVNQTQTEM